MEVHMRKLFIIAALLAADRRPGRNPARFPDALRKGGRCAASAERGARFFNHQAGRRMELRLLPHRQADRPAATPRPTRPIAALAPAANVERFTDAAKVDKWFRRNCNDTLNRVCSAQEKADVMAWLLAQK
jgi:hypothetical protein